MVLTNRFEVYIPEAFQVNPNHLRIESYMRSFKFSDNFLKTYPSKEVNNKEGIEGVALEDLIIKLSEKYNYGELTISDFDYLKRKVFLNMEDSHIKDEEWWIDRHVFLHQNALNFVGKWYEMEKIIRQTKILLPLEERLKIPSQLEGLVDIKFK